MSLPLPLKLKATAECKSMTLREVGSWIYDLGADPDEVHDLDIDMAVLGLTIDGTDEGILTSDEINHMKIGADGSRRLILCETALAVADPKRPYWKWGDDYPPWVFGTLGSGYAVNIMASQWHDILAEEVAKIESAGFDGIWLDCSYPVPIVAEMADLVWRVRKLTNKIIVLANGEHLIAFPQVEDMVDGFGKIGLYSGPSDEEDLLARDEAEIHLSKATKPVFVVEHCVWDEDDIARLRAAVSEQGWNPCIVTNSGCA